MHKLKQNLGHLGSAFILTNLKLKSTSINSKEFRNGVATTLPIGTKFYKARGEFSESVKS